MNIDSALATRVSYTRDQDGGRTLLSVEFNEEKFTHLAQEGRQQAAMILIQTALRLMNCETGDYFMPVMP